MRFLAVSALLATSCITPWETAECAEAPDCFNGGTTCNPACVEVTLERRDCCECLVEFECTDATVERCESNLKEGGAVNVSEGCSDDRARCGTSCPMLSDVED